MPVDQSDPAFFETPYYVVPDKRSAKAYVLLREALKSKNAFAVATFVLRAKEHLAALMPAGSAIMLEVLRYGHELRDAEDMLLPKDNATIGERELAMAEPLIDGMMTDWEPSKYKDRYRGVVLKMLAEKAKPALTQPLVRNRYAKLPPTWSTFANRAWRRTTSASPTTRGRRASPDSRRRRASPLPANRYANPPPQR